MSKGKNMTKQKKNPRYFSRSDFEIRPVERSDKWCKIWDFEKMRKKIPSPEAPWGYVMMIPNYRHGMKIKPEGYVIRSKVFQKTLMLQIVTGKSQFCEGRQYHTTMLLPQNASTPEEKPKEKKKSKKKGKKGGRKKQRRYLNIRRD